MPFLELLFLASVVATLFVIVRLARARRRTRYELGTAVLMLAVCFMLIRRIYPLETISTTADWVGWGANGLAFLLALALMASDVAFGD